MTPPAPGYRVVRSEDVKDQLRLFRDRAFRLGIQQEVREALLHIENRLQKAPLEWGDPVNDFRALGLRGFRGLQGPFIVEYAVNEAHRVVIVRQYRIKPGHPLAQET